MLGIAINGAERPSPSDGEKSWRRTQRRHVAQGIKEITMAASKETQSGKTVAEQVGDWAAAVRADKLPAPTRAAARRLLLDVTGLCVAARKGDYVEALLSTALSDGKATAIGHART